MDKQEESLGCGGSCGTCGGCGHDHDHDHDDSSLPIIVLTDENGNDVTFEKLDVVVLDGRSFLILAEVKDDESDEIDVVILEIKEEDGEEVYDTVVDEEISKKVYSQFLKQQGIDEEEE